MCRRTLELVCRHHEPSMKNVSDGLKKLHDDKVIDNRLFEWAQALRADGNLAAHEIEAGIGHDDAQDLTQFSEAILDYVFVLHEQFEAYRARRAKKPPRKRPKARPDAKSA